MNKFTATWSFDRSLPSPFVSVNVPLNSNSLGGWVYPESIRPIIPAWGNFFFFRCLLVFFYWWLLPIAASLRAFQTGQWLLFIVSGCDHHPWCDHHHWWDHYRWCDHHCWCDQDRWCDHHHCHVKAGWEKAWETSWQENPWSEEEDLFQPGSLAVTLLIRITK